MNPPTGVPNEYRTPALDARGVLVPAELDAPDLCTAREAARLLGCSRENLGKLRVRGVVRGWPARQDAKGGRSTDYRYLIAEVAARVARTVPTAGAAPGDARSDAIVSSATLGEREFLRRENAELELARQAAEHRAVLAERDATIARLEFERDAAVAERARLRAMLGAYLSVDDPGR